ncbi:alpha-galactosidase [Ruania alba]|uniref:Alpha-galactosidase n=1 Tax=Ruania alba TaxID=648782 RepID=A0A1H5M7Q0_9MICO|nr:alpha-galactosidase [Ruania alba]SEE84761.1 alpha-galactosidase [Ruania alba]
MTASTLATATSVDSCALTVLQSDQITVVVDATRGVPRVLYWGPRLDAGTDDLAYLATLAVSQGGSDALQGAGPPALLPEQWTGWAGTPGLEGHRDGSHFAHRFEPGGHTVTETGGAQVLTVHGVDETAGLALTSTLELFDSGVLRVNAAITNSDDESSYTVDGLRLALPVPVEAQEIIDFIGRHLRERTPQRHPFVIGTHLREGRRGRTGSDAATVLVAGTPGVGFGSGEAWAVHTAWSGNHATYAELALTGAKVIGGGEVLLPGEVVLAPGQQYRSPWLYASYGAGLDAVGGAFHAYLRSRPHHPASPRPVVLNTWEAVYFDQDTATLSELARVAARVGVERFVVDDGWFISRRDDTAGLGDWRVDAEVWPDGLGPLVSTVRELGMDFGLWFEPEMVNGDSILAREHPDWIMAPGERLPVTGRSQHVLNLTIPEAYTYILESISTLVTEYGIDYIKWDHNRDLTEAGTRASSRAAVHGQTRAVYALMDELRRRHPALEIESCSSGGGRVDLEVLERTDRVWASDCIDPLERQQIQRWTGLLLPPELVGAHIGSPRAHTTHRTHDLAFRAATALFGHLGIEWDLRTATEAELDEVAAWVELYKTERGLIHSGTAVHADYPDPAYWAHGYVAPDKSRALYSFVAMATMVASQPGRIRLPGLDPDARYRIEPIQLSASALVRRPAGPPAWWSEPTVLSGRVLATAGLQGPVLYPEQALLFRLVREQDA